MHSSALALLLTLSGIAVSAAAFGTRAEDVAWAHAPFLVPACLGLIAGVI